jgi:hypothetical protein
MFLRAEGTSSHGAKEGGRGDGGRAGRARPGGAVDRALVFFLCHATVLYRMGGYITTTGMYVYMYVCV